MHKPIHIQNLSLSFNHKVCFENFSAQIHYGERIAIIGANGSGKSTLLKWLAAYASEEIKVPKDAMMAYVPQIVVGFDTLSGSERFNKALTQALSSNPNVLLLDEPTNHLDRRNKQSLLRLLKHYTGTLIVVSHDTELLRNSVDILWHIDNGKIQVFSGNYEDYRREIMLKRASIEQELSRLNRQKKDTHQALMKEQTRAAKSRAKGEKSIREHKWPLGGKATALRAEETSGRKKLAIEDKKQALSEQLVALRLPEMIVPKFSLNSADLGDKPLVVITAGSVGYLGKAPLLNDLHLTLRAHQKIAILGDNGSGKSTFFKAILRETQLFKTGSWHMPQQEDIGYLDQHYATLAADKTVCDTIAAQVPMWSHADIRRHLNDFLFRKNEEVNALVEQLSGGEKVRLCLAHIAAFTPKLLILDEITNNLDLETKAHVIQVLSHYPGAMMLISHDEDFLQAIGITERYTIVQGTLVRD